MPASFPLSIDERTELKSRYKYVQSEVQDGWSTYLGRWTWNYFITVTFREARLPHKADRTLRSIAGVIKQHSDGNLFLGTELHLNRTLHVHGLFSPKGSTDDIQKHTADQVWGDLYDKFGRSQVRKVRENQAVSDYVSKYVTKGLTEWFMST